MVRVTGSLAAGVCAATVTAPVRNAVAKIPIRGSMRMDSPPEDTLQASSKYGCGHYLLLSKDDAKWTLDAIDCSTWSCPTKDRARLLRTPRILALGLMIEDRLVGCFILR